MFPLDTIHIVSSYVTRQRKKRKKQEPIRLMYTCFKCVTSDVCNKVRITNDKLTQELRKKQ